MASRFHLLCFFCGDVAVTILRMSGAITILRMILDSMLGRGGYVAMV